MVTEPISSDSEPAESRTAAASRFPCSACGAELVFSPSQQQLVCPYCGSLETIPQGQRAIVEHSFDEALELQHEDTIPGLDCEVRCDVCGVTILVPAKTVTRACPYCASTIVNDPQAAEKMYPPESLLPFKLERREAVAAFRRWLKGLWFAPGDLTQLATEGQILGLYVPHWTFDSSTESKYHGMRGDHYWVTVVENVRDANGNTTQRTRQEMRTRWTPASGTVAHDFDDVLVVASHSLPNDSMQALAPWKLADLVPFEPGYLSGFQTERYQVDLRAGFTLAQGIMDQEIRTLCMQDIGGDVQQLSGVRTQHRNVTFKHLLLPVWHSVYRYREKPFHFLVNAQTGEVVGARPISWWKVSGAILGAVSIAGIIILLVQLFSR